MIVRALEDIRRAVATLEAMVPSYTLTEAERVILMFIALYDGINPEELYYALRLDYSSCPDKVYDIKQSVTSLIDRHIVVYDPDILIATRSPICNTKHRKGSLYINHDRFRYSIWCNWNNNQLLTVGVLLQNAVYHMNNFIEYSTHSDMPPLPMEYSHFYLFTYLIRSVLYNMIGTIDGTNSPNVISLLMKNEEAIDFLEKLGYIRVKRFSYRLNKRAILYNGDEKDFIINVGGKRALQRV